jgi:hypothetical protein
MPANVVRLFGKSDAAFDKATQWARDHADDEGVLSVVEVFGSVGQAVSDEERGVIWVVSSDCLERFFDDRPDKRIATLDSYGVDPGEMHDVLNHDEAGIQLCEAATAAIVHRYRDSWPLLGHRLRRALIAEDVLARLALTRDASADEIRDQLESAWSELQLKGEL